MLLAHLFVLHVYVLIELRSHFANRTFYLTCFVLRNYSVTQGEDCTVNCTEVYTTDSSKTVVPMLFLFWVAL